MKARRLRSMSTWTLCNARRPKYYLNNQIKSVRWTREVIRRVNEVTIDRLARTNYNSFENPRVMQKSRGYQVTFSSFFLSEEECEGVGVRLLLPNSSRKSVDWGGGMGQDSSIINQRNKTCYSCDLDSGTIFYFLADPDGGKQIFQSKI